MSLEALLTSDLQVWQSVPVLDIDDEPTLDGFGQPVEELDLVGTVRGRIFALSTFEQRLAVEGSRSVVKRYRAILELPTFDLDERSTIIDDESGVYDVLEVNRAVAFSDEHHLEVQLEKVNA